MSNKLSIKEDFEGIFHSYYGKVVRFIANIVKSEDIAADIAQDIFLKLWESRDSINITGSLNSYIYSFARNATMNYLRSQRIERVYNEYQLSIISELYDAEESYDVREALLIVRKCVLSMPEPRREIFVLSRKTGLTNVQIAEKLGVNVKTVEYHISKALKELRLVVKK